MSRRLGTSVSSHTEKYEALNNVSRREVCKGSGTANVIMPDPENLSPFRLKSSRQRRNAHSASLVMRAFSHANWLNNDRQPEVAVLY